MWEFGCDNTNPNLRCLSKKQNEKKKNTTYGQVMLAWPICLLLDFFIQADMWKY
jgi:hypothetical protein